MESSGCKHTLELIYVFGNDQYVPKAKKLNMISGEIKLRNKKKDQEYYVIFM